MFLIILSKISILISQKMVDYFYQIVNHFFEKSFFLIKKKEFRFRSL